ncbi:hypothetical protein JOB18_009601 [Solea senegalensis]|nr:hypothetical protein JOB18_009601 [Solea senegalensis]
MCGLTLGFFAVVLSFLGMECTFIGGGDKTKDKMLFSGAVFHVAGGEYKSYMLVYLRRATTETFDPHYFLVSTKPLLTGVSNIAGYCLYINRVARTTFSASLGPGVLRYDLGPPIFLGLVGCFLIFLGAIFYAVTVFRVICPESKVVYAYGGGTYMVPRSRGRTYTGYYRPSWQYGSYQGSGPSNSSKISKLSQTTPTKMSERDAFV